MTDQRKAFEEKFDAQLKGWSLELAMLKAKADKAKAEAKIDCYKTIETLQGKHDSARTKLRELRAAGDDAWEDLKTGAERAWTEVKASFSSADSRFK